MPAPILMTGQAGTGRMPETLFPPTTPRPHEPTDRNRPRHKTSPPSFYFKPTCAPSLNRNSPPSHPRTHRSMHHLVPLHSSTCFLRPHRRTRRNSYHTTSHANPVIARASALAFQEPLLTGLKIRSQAAGTPTALRIAPSPLAQRLWLANPRRCRVR